MLKFSPVPVMRSYIYGEINDLEFNEVKVTLNGTAVQVHGSRESAVPFNRVWPGKQRTLDQTEMAGFVNFAADEAVVVKVEVTGDWEFDKAVIRPLSKNIKPQVNGKEVTFTLTEPGQYALELGTCHQLINFFFDPITSQVKAEDVDYYFGPGIHFPEVIRLKSGDRVYIDSGAVVFGSILGIGVQDIHIFGGGILHGGTENRIFCDFMETNLKSTIKFYNSDHIRIEGIIVQDSSNWTTSFFGCSDVVIDNYKVVGQWRYNTDGIDLISTRDVQITNSFVRTFDDGIVLGASDAVKVETVPDLRREVCICNVFVKNCTVWCGWGRSLEVGIVTCTPEYKNILFEDCDLIHNSASCLDIQNGNYATIHDVTFRNIRVEYQSEALPEICQKSDDMVYDNAGRMGVPKLLNVDNHRYGGQNGKFGDTFDILFEDIKVLAEDGVSEKLPIRFGNFSNDVKVADITIRNLTVNGRKISSPDEMDLQVVGKVNNINWE